MRRLRLLHNPSVPSLSKHCLPCPACIEERPLGGLGTCGARVGIWC